MNNNTLKSIKNKRSSQLLILATVLLGLIVGMQVRESVETNAASMNTKQQLEALNKEIEEEKAISAQLQNEIAFLEKDNQERYNALEISKDDKAISILNDNLSRIKKFAGLTDVQGPGLIIKLADAEEIPESMLLEDPSYYIVHQSDLREIVNELLAGGAEAVSINGERLIATSTQMCAGPTIIINSKRYTSPYEIRAIGHPRLLREQLEQSAVYNILSVYFDSDSFNITESEEVFIPKYIINTKEN